MSEDTNTGHWNTGDWNTGHLNTGHLNTGHRNTGDTNTGHRNTGDWNTGDWNTGYFNVDTPSTVRAFGVDCLRSDWDAARKPSWLYSPSPTTWVAEGEMADVEKFENPTFRTCGGYLRKNDWKAEWRKALSGVSDEDIQAVRDLPNFDYDIFEEITGLDLRPEQKVADSDCTGKVVVIDGVSYTLSRTKNNETDAD